MKILLYSLFLLYSASMLNAQEKADTTKNIIYIGGGRQGLTYLKYERLIYNKNWTQTIVNLGLGGIPGDSEYGIYRTNKIMPEVGQLFGYKNIYVELGIEPSLNFYGSVSYVDLNGIIGLRYQSRTKQLRSLFIQCGYNPKLYYTYKSDINVPFYIGLGLNF